MQMVRESRTAMLCLATIAALLVAITMMVPAASAAQPDYPVTRVFVDGKAEMIMAGWGADARFRLSKGCHEIKVVTRYDGAVSRELGRHCSDQTQVLHVTIDRSGDADVRYTTTR